MIAGAPRGGVDLRTARAGRRRGPRSQTLENKAKSRVLAPALRASREAEARAAGKFTPRRGRDLLDFQARL
jgi:hypothetical protein